MKVSKRLMLVHDSSTNTQPLRFTAARVSLQQQSEGELMDKITQITPFLLFHTLESKHNELTCDLNPFIIVRSFSGAVVSSPANSYELTPLLAKHNSHVSWLLAPQLTANS